MPNSKNKSGYRNENGDAVCKRINPVTGVAEVCLGLDAGCKSYPICHAGGAVGMNVAFFDQCPWTYRQVWVAVAVEAKTTIEVSPTHSKQKPESKSGQGA